MNCRFCSKQYSRVFYLKRHEACCQLLHSNSQQRKQALEESEDVPSPLDTYILLQEAVNRLKTLEDRITKLERNAPISKKKGIQLMLESKVKPNQCLEYWLSNINISQQALQSSFDGDFAIVIANELINYIEKHSEDIPLAVSGRKESALYGFIDDKWCELNSKQIKDLYLSLSSKMFTLFKKWQDDLGDDIYSESGSRLYHKGVQTIMTGSQCKSNDLSRFRSTIQSNFPHEKRI